MKRCKTKVIFFALMTSLFLALFVSNRESEIESTYPPITDHSLSARDSIFSACDIQIPASSPSTIFQAITVVLSSHPLDKIHCSADVFIIHYLSRLIPRPRDDTPPPFQFPSLCSYPISFPKA